MARFSFSLHVQFPSEWSFNPYTGPQNITTTITTTTSKCCNYCSRTGASRTFKSEKNLIRSSTHLKVVWTLLLMKVEERQYLLEPDQEWARAGPASHMQISHPFCLNPCNFDRHFPNSLQCCCRFQRYQEYIISWRLHFLRDFKTCWEQMEKFEKWSIWRHFCWESIYPQLISCLVLSLISIFTP